MTATLYEKNNRYHVMITWFVEGKRYRKSKATGLTVKGNKRKAQTMADEMLREMQSKVTENYSDISFPQYMRLWLEEIEMSIAESTFSEYTRQINNVICPWFEKQNVQLCDLKAHHIENFYRYKQKCDGVSPNTIRKYHANIRKALQRAVQTERIASNPADKVILPKATKFRGSFYSAEELKELFECSQNTNFETVIRLAGYLGVREGEACGLKWSDVNFDKNTISVRGSLKTKGKNRKLYYGETKNESSYRSFPIPGELENYLKKLRKKQLEQRMLCGNSYNREWIDFVCVDAMGNVLSPAYVSRYFGTLLEKNGLRKIRFHDLRHSCAALLLENGATMKQVQEWLGHYSYLVTADTYAHVFAESKKNMADTMSELLSIDGSA